MTNSLRRRVGQVVSRMTPGQARALVEKIGERTQREGATIQHPEIREITGGYASQNINFYVMRKLGIKAGMIKEQQP